MELAELKKLLEEKGRAFEEYKKQNDERLAALGKGTSTEDFEAKLKKYDERIAELTDRIKAGETERARLGNPDSGETADPEYKAGFVNFMRKGDASAIEAKAVNTGSGSDGGFAVPQEVDTDILQLLGRETPMRAICGQRTVGTEEYKKLVNLGGAGSGWVGETDERPETATPRLAEVAPFFGEIYANPAATQKSLDDLFFNVESWLSEEVVREFTEKENAAFTSGDGVKKPKGFLAYANAATGDGARPFGTLQFKASGAAAAITPDGLLDLIYSLKRGYRQNASFVLNNLSVAAVRKLKDNEGNYLWQPGLQAGQPDRLLGYQAVESDDMPDIAANSLPLAFGDFRRGYLIVDRVGIRVLRDPYTKKPFVQFYTTKRVGGGVVDSNAIKLMKIAAA
ncbi:50S ribosomal protein L28 [Ralstonia solanacearum]|nr:50S ribosomal protein L28 [Ralstonia solanacearum]